MMKPSPLYRTSQGSSENQSRRLLSNNPFRQFKSPTHENFSSGLVRLSKSAFDEWVEKNRKFIDSDEDDEEILGEDIVGFYGSLISPEKSGGFKPKPLPSIPVRTGSDSSVIYHLERKMSSNNPFALAMNDEYVHYRDPPLPPQLNSRTSTPPSRTRRSPSNEVAAPPSYEEAAGPEVSKEFPKEKESSSNSSSSRTGNLPPPRPPAMDSSKNDKLRRSRSESDKKGASHHRSSSGRHRSERKEKDRERKLRSGKSPAKKPQPVKSKNLDTIDKLDVTAFFGGGFHHDGPFDACTPHRNKNVKAAPVMAFPADGPNNSIQGATKVDKHPHIDTAFGNYDDAQNEIVGRKMSYKHSNRSDPSSSLYLPKQNPSIVNFDAKQKAIPIHGEVTPGLGSSTFVDGAPAPKAVQADEYLSPNTGGIGRKKSLVQRLRKNSASENPSRRGSLDEQVYGEDEYGGSSGSGAGNLLLRRVKSLKVGRK